MTLEAGVTAIERHAHRGHLLSVATAMIALGASAFSTGTFSADFSPERTILGVGYSLAHMPFPSDVGVKNSSMKQYAWEAAWS